MSNANQRVDIYAADSALLDAFGRMRVSSPVTIFDSKSVYPVSDGTWDTSVSGGGSVAHVPLESCYRLSTGDGSSGSKAIWQTRQYHQYQPGKSQLILMTTNIGAAKVNVRQRFGYFDADDGLFFEQVETALKVVIRTSTSGSPVDTAYTQSAWNIDRMDGSMSSKNPSHVTLDTSKAHIAFIDLEYLGVGRVRFGLVIDGRIYYVHEVNNANSLASVYMGEGSQPLRYEIENTGAASGATTMDAICQTVISEGGFDVGGHPSTFNVGLVARTAASGVWTPILGIRPTATFRGKTNRATIKPTTYSLLGLTKDVAFRFVYNTTATGASWVSDNTITALDYDISASALTGGRYTKSRYVGAGGNLAGNVNEDIIFGKTALTLDISGANPTNIYIEAAGLGGAASVYASIDCQEFY